MKKLMKTGALILLASLVVAATGAVVIWRAMDKPRYLPGMVRSEKKLRAPLAPPPQAGDTNFWQMETEIRLYHFASGHGRPVLVIHGGPGRRQLKSWAGLESLTPQYRFIYYDQRGCGHSTRPIDHLDPHRYYQSMIQLETTLGLGAQIADLERIRRILGEEKLMLIGHSFGGFLAALYAAEFPEHVASLVLVAPADVLVMPGHGELFAEVKARLPEDQRPDYDRWLQRYLDFKTVFSKSETDWVALNHEFDRYYRRVTTTEFPESASIGGLDLSGADLRNHL